MPATPSTPLLANIKKVSRHSENLTEYYESVNSNLHPYTVIIKGISNRFDNGGERFFKILERERKRGEEPLSFFKFGEFVERGRGGGEKGRREKYLLYY